MNALLLLVALSVPADDELDSLVAQLDAKKPSVKVKDCGCQEGQRCVCGKTCPCAAPAKNTPADGDTTPADDGGPPWTWRNARPGKPAGWYRMVAETPAAGACANGSCGQSAALSGGGFYSSGGCANGSCGGSSGSRGFFRGRRGR